MKITMTQLRAMVQEEVSRLNEKWDDDAKIKQLDKYGKDEMTKDELCAKRDKLRANKNKTEKETTELRRINFAIRSRQKGRKFGKVNC